MKVIRFMLFLLTKQMNFRALTQIVSGIDYKKNPEPSDSG
jgi:hypothetical protein